jgi:hypothetical protein
VVRDGDQQGFFIFGGGSHVLSLCFLTIHILARLAANVNP